ncbi:MAG: preprotein translocase subunit YajC [Chthoniobacterales bacterium]
MIFSSFTLLAQATPNANPLSSLLPILFLVPIFYVLIIRPQQKRQKELKTLITSMKTGDKIITNAGLHGIVSNVKEKTFLLKVADNVKLEFDKSAVAVVESRSDVVEA